MQKERERQRERGREEKHMGRRAMIVCHAYVCDVVLFSVQVSVVSSNIKVRSK